MKKALKNLAASIRIRLQNIAKETNRPFSEILQYYGMERFLYRLSCSQHADKFVLKGALMFAAWHIAQRRTTLDIDFLSYYDSQIAIIENAIKDICSMTVVPDGIFFDPGTVKGQKIKEDADYEGVRVKFRGVLDRARIPMQVDVGFGDLVYPKLEAIAYPVLLDLPKPHLKGYPVESVISEKFEAIVKLGLFNSRMKDFYDIWLLMRRFNIDKVKLNIALRKTFIHRKTPLPEEVPLFAEEIYNEQSDRQLLWQAFLKKSGIKHVPSKLSAVAVEIESFLLKILRI
ncbi:nucleotidyl transferase AbiEii/AbiGii toxin family protein [Candidatus Saganbacteria bacterium]|nr:nucleotidyl transferase AbiEii/AbiGii toxin family protein [Candidatus Saganbacteria bacterium]